MALLILLALSVGLLIACGGTASSKSSSSAEGACCVSTACSITSQAACSGGHWLGGNTVCAPNPCEASDDDDNDDTAGETVWTDPTTGHMWQNGTTVGSTIYSWPDVQSYCAGLSWGGYTGWRLPDIDELRSLIRGCAATQTNGSCGVTDSCLDGNCENAACDDGCPQFGGPGPGGVYWPPEISGAVTNYWSSSAVPNTDNGPAWYIHFDVGVVSYHGLPGVNGARCVR